MNISRKIVNKLLKPLGFHAYYDHPSQFYAIEDNQRNYICISNCLGHLTYEDIIDSLQTNEYFRIYRTNAKSINPYFGCKSLEEMMIKKDLISENF